MENQKLVVLITLAISIMLNLPINVVIINSIFISLWDVAVGD